MGDAIKSVDSSGKTSYMKRPDPVEQAARAERDDEENRKRKREKKDAEQRKWEKELKGRKYTCERQVDRSKMGTHAIIDIINQWGLQFFFKPIKGYKPKLVLDFYTNMEIDESEEKIQSKMGKKTVLITPSIIAKYLDNYKRPGHGSTTYPATAWSKTEEEIQKALTDKPLKTDRFVHGKLFEKYRVANKVVHYNLFPHGSEKRPRKEDGEVIFVFGSSEEVVDWAKFIWNQMVKFRQRSGPSKANIPFPAMVTCICESQGVMTPERLLPGTPGPITGGSLEKSKSLSQPPPSETFGLPKSTAKTSSGRIEEYTRIMAAQLQSVQTKQKKLETQMRRTRRDVSAIKRGMLWIAARCGREGDVYVPTEADMRESTPEEPEIEHGVGTSGVGASSSRKKGKEHRKLIIIPESQVYAKAGLFQASLQCVSRKYLVESNGEILLVFLIVSRKSIHSVDNVEVHRLQFNTLSWVKMERIGDRTFNFLSTPGVDMRNSVDLKMNIGD
ncbi:hypothetical protein RHSIM_Rhsim05G0111900 [Rhododendron simsii]|uniref:Uncharacterized protein n=1 Tax=Rhododendron simsii TaxID=118357 RepID=A0A834H102_RHOSS|nr:hypothetical protein RHSIM_Rhsim05G0111900 [Rhododendron simsii]